MKSLTSQTRSADPALIRSYSSDPSIPVVDVPEQHRLSAWIVASHNLGRVSASAAQECLDALFGDSVVKLEECTDVRPAKKVAAKKIPNPKQKETPNED